MSTKWWCHICEKKLSSNRNRHFNTGKHKDNADLFDEDVHLDSEAQEQHIVPELNSSNSNEAEEEQQAMQVDSLLSTSAAVNADDASVHQPAVSAEFLLHLFCSQKNISIKNEKILFNIVSLPAFGRGFVIQTFEAFRKQLDIILQGFQPASTMVHCRPKYQGQKNYKPIDPTKVGPPTPVPVYNIREHLEKFLADEELSSAVITYHNCSGEVFSDFTSGMYFRDLCVSLPDNVIPLCLELYWDDTGISSRRKCGPLWIGISNTAPSIKRSTRSRMLIAVLPGNADLNQVFDEIVKQVESIKLHPFHFGCFGRSVLCNVTLSLVLGDAPASNSAIGLRGPTCSSPCRLCLVSIKDLNSIPEVDLNKSSLDNLPWSIRSPEAYFNLLSDVQKNHKRGEMEYQEGRLKELGIGYYASKLWRISGVNLFTQSPYCILHNEFLGLIPFHMDCTLKTLPDDSIGIIRERVVQFPNLPNLPALNADIVDRKGWEGKAYLAFYKMSLIVFRGLLSEKAMLCWRAHCRYIRYLLKPSISTVKLENLMATYWQWKALFIELYGEPSNDNKVSKKKMTFLNLHVGEHWSHYIKLYGMPAEYSTQHWESLHRQVKQKERKTNHKSPYKDISKQIIEQQMLQYKFGTIESYMNNDNIERALVGSCILMNKTNKILNPNAEAVVIDLLLQMNIATQYQHYKSAIFQEKKFSVGDNFSYPTEHSKTFAKIVGIINSANFVGLVGQTWEFAEPNIDDGQTEFYSLIGRQNEFICVNIEVARKEQILQLAPSLHLVNFYY